MRKIYIDSDFKCHVANNADLIAVETDFFDDKCDSFVEGYRYIPAGQSRTNEDGTVFAGEMIAPWMDYSTLVAYQHEYEAMQAELAAAYQEGVNSV